MKYIRSGVDFFTTDTGLTIYPVFGSKYYRFTGDCRIQEYMLQLLTNHVSLEEAKDDARQHFGERWLAEIEFFCDFLSEKNLIAEESTVYRLPSEVRTRYERQIAYFEQSNLLSRYGEANQIQRKISNIRMTIIGCGGAGAPVAEILAASGINHFKLIDDDVVELSNLGRQICYHDSDIGSPKVSCLANRLYEINPFSNVEPITTRIDHSNCRPLLNKSDFVVLAADEPLPELPFWIDEACNSLGISYACLSNCPPEVRLGPILSPTEGIDYSVLHAGLRNRWPDVDAYEKASNGFHSNKASTPWACYAVASLLVGQIIDYVITGTSEISNSMAILNTESLSSEVITI